MSNVKQVNNNNAFEQLRDIIVEIIGEDVAEILDIQPKSRFVDDLGMDSIRIVMLVERGDALYERQIDFATWLKGMSLRALSKLTVGDVADFIEKSLEEKNAEKQYVKIGGEELAGGQWHVSK